MSFRLIPYIFTFCIAFGFAMFPLDAQTKESETEDSLVIYPWDSLFKIPEKEWTDKEVDSLYAYFLKIDADTLFSDSLFLYDSIYIDSALVDSLNKAEELAKKPKKKKSEIEAPVYYNAQDSLFFDMIEKKVYLFGKANITYQDVNLNADYIVFGMKDKLVYASGVADTSGELHGTPVFKDGDETFEAERLTYNFETRKGVIHKVITEQDGGFLHGEKIKRHNNEHIHIKKGKYTTCNEEHPHFYLAMTKAKVIPQDKIVAGPSFLVIEDVPLYFVGLPFGFFPNTKGSKSGVLIPEYGEEKRRGFFLREGGYYWAVNQYMDMKILGSKYTNGTWGLHNMTNYVKKYRYNGSFDGEFIEEVEELILEDTSTVSGRAVKHTYLNDIRIIWRHNQDPKANPYSRFTANVNYSTTTFSQNQDYSYASRVNTTQASNITYYKTWPNSPFNLSTNFRHSQNNRDRSVIFKFPEVTFDMTRQYPFKSLKKAGKQRWYEDVQISYAARFQNELRTNDTLLYQHTEQTLNRDMKNGFTHNAPISMNIKATRHLTITPNLTYTGVMYSKQIRKSWQTYYDDMDSVFRQGVLIDTNYGMIYAHSVRPTLATTYSPKLYGMYQTINPDAKIAAVKHVITPTATLSFTPDIRKFVPNYWDTVYKYNNPDSGIATIYSRFEQEMYGTPSLNGKNGNLALSLRNTLEMKSRIFSDTAVTYKKTKLLEQFDFSTNYNIFADSLKWNDISSTIGTRLFNNLINIRILSDFSPYAFRTDEDGRSYEINRSLYKDEGKLARLTRSTFSIGFGLSNTMFDKEEDKKENEEEMNEEDSEAEEREMTEREKEESKYAYFYFPWSMNISYNYTYARPFVDITKMQTVSLSGNLTPTKNWRISYNTGYDFTTKKMTLTSGSITRDLHCWEMSVSFSPFGDYKFYLFRINVKSTMLQDLKYEKRKNWRDY